MAKDKGILLESGTNELEILEFIVGSNAYGINVAKVKEILPYSVPTPVPNAHPYIEGVMMPRDFIISVVDLSKCLHLTKTDETAKDMYIVTGFNQLNIAFHVHGIVGIERVSWSDIIAPDATISNSNAATATGIIKRGEKLVIILDFEKIISDISPEVGIRTTDIEGYKGRERNNVPIVIAEDSKMLGKLLEDCLQNAGYTNLKLFENGARAWDYLQTCKAEKSIDKHVHCVITDIEMPQMDGHHLLKLIKNENAFSAIPVVIFSSLISDEMKRKGEALGADAQLTKPEVGSLVEALDRILGR